MTPGDRRRPNAPPWVWPDPPEEEREPGCLARQWREVQERGVYWPFFVEITAMSAFIVAASANWHYPELIWAFFGWVSATYLSRWKRRYVRETWRTREEIEPLLPVRLWRRWRARRDRR